MLAVSRVVVLPPPGTSINRELVEDMSSDIAADEFSLRRIQIAGEETSLLASCLDHLEDSLLLVRLTPSRHRPDVPTLDFGIVVGNVREENLLGIRRSEGIDSNIRARIRLVVIN